jgi:Tol biopolymer transport system component
MPQESSRKVNWGRKFAAVASLVISSGCIPLSAQQSLPPSSETISFRVLEGSRLSFDLSPDGKSIVFDLLGQLWVIPTYGGDAQPITNAVRDTAEDLDPSFSSRGRVVFKAERNGRRGLWLLEPGGQAPTQITELPNQFARDGGASWSPDGKLVAFSRFTIGESVGARPRSDLIVLDIATLAMRELPIVGLPNPAARDPAWSPDGNRIAFVAGYAAGSRGGRIWIVDRSGGTAAPVTDSTVKAFAPAFSPNGRSIAFFAPDSSARTQLWTQDYQAGTNRPPAPKQLTNLEDVSPTRVRWLADGSTLVFSANGRLWRIPAAGGVATEIPFSASLSITRPRSALPPARFALPGERQPARAFMGLAISPDGRRIGAIALGKLWIIPVGGAARAIAEVPPTARYLAWSPDGAEVAWSAGDFGQEDLFATIVATGTTRKLTAIPGREVLPAYSPDGHQLAFAHVTDSAKTLRLISTAGKLIGDTANARSLGPIDVSWTASNVAPPVWSPDSRALVIDAGWNENVPTRGLMLKLAGGRDTLARFPDAPTFMQWISDGSVIFVRHDRLWRAQFDSSGMVGEPRAMGNAPAMYASAARDGTVLFISEGGLRLRSPDGQERKLGWPISYTPPIAAPLLIRNVQLFNGIDTEASEPSDVLIQRGKIARIAKAGSIAANDAHVIDARGKFAIPGLVDLHAHNYRPDVLSGFLYFGVTTLRDQGADIAPLIAYNDAIAAGLQPGARVMYGGFQFYSDWPFDEEQGRGIEPEADPDHVRRGVALAEAFGAQHIKTRTFRRWDINARMIREAHRRGMRATGHCAYPLPLVAAGMDAQEHIDMCNSRVGAYYLSDIYVYDDMVQLLRTAGISVVPTVSYLSLPARLNANPKLLEGDAELAPFVPPLSNFDWMLNLSPQERNAYSRAARAAREAAAKLARAGVTIGTGTDVWQVPTGVHMELEELVAGGLSPAAAIRAATSDAAEIIGAERDLGSIEPGKLADIVLLDANPLDDIRNTRRISAVIQAGHIVNRDLIRREAQFRAARQRR